MTTALLGRLPGVSFLGDPEPREKPIRLLDRLRKPPAVRRAEALGIPAAPRVELTPAERVEADRVLSNAALDVATEQGSTFDSVDWSDFDAAKVRCPRSPDPIWDWEKKKHEPRDGYA